MEDRPDSYHAPRPPPGFLEAIASYPAPVRTIDASGDPEAVARQIRDEVAHALAIDPRPWTGPSTPSAGPLPRAGSRHAFLFVGPEGIGKRSFAETFAQALLCERVPEVALDPCGACPSLPPGGRGDASGRPPASPGPRTSTTSRSS